MRARGHVRLVRLRARACACARARARVHVRACAYIRACACGTRRAANSRVRVSVKTRVRVCMRAELDIVHAAAHAPRSCACARTARELCACAEICLEHVRPQSSRQVPNSARIACSTARQRIRLLFCPFWHHCGGVWTIIVAASGQSIRGLENRFVALKIWDKSFLVFWSEWERGESRR
eukprot:6185581-Pleurochrysis_carterae.AAC.1